MGQEAHLNFKSLQLLRYFHVKYVRFMLGANLRVLTRRDVQIHMCVLRKLN